MQGRTIAAAELCAPLVCQGSGVDHRDQRQRCNWCVKSDVVDVPLIFGTDGLGGTAPPSEDFAPLEYSMSEAALLCGR